MKDSVRRALVAGLLGISCAREQKQQDTEAVGSSFQSLTATATRVFAFEGTIGGASSDWVTTSGTISASTSIKSEGTKALSIISSSNPTLTSIAIGPLGSIASPATLDVRLPSNLAGLSWQGQVALSFNSVTSGIYDQRSDWAPFNNLPTGTFQRISISIPAALVSVLSSSTASDLKVGIILQLSSNTQAAYLDRLTFAAGGASGSGGAGSGGTAGVAGKGGTGGKATGGTGTGGKATGGTGTGGAPACSPTDCNDNNACTTDVCSSGACLHNPVAAGTACPDSTVCNGAETCNASGTCVAGTPPVVNDGNPCTTDSCNAVTGVAHTPVAAGTACPDGTVCNGEETCNASGICVAGTPLVVDDGNSCTTDSCNPVTGVNHGILPDGAGCSDSNACTQSDSCLSGTCVGSSPKACSPAGACHAAGACDPTSGSCTYVFQPSGTNCDDGNVCNGVSTCNGAGACVATIGSPNVDDQNPCTKDACNPSTGVSHTPVAGGTACSGGKVCNGTGSCVSNPTTMSIELPTGLTTSQVALGATSRLVLGDRDLMVAGTSGIPYITNTGTTQTEIGANATVGNTWGRGTVFLRSNSTVNGNVYSTTPISTQDGAVVNGTVYPSVVGGIVYPSAPFDPVARYTWTVALQWGGAPFEAVEQTVDLPPGNYSDVSLWHGSVVKLSAGEYMADNFIVGSGATLVLPASGLPVSFNIKGNFTVQGSVSVPDTSAALPILSILGSGTAYVETPFNGVIFAPYGHVTIGAGTSPSFRGAIFGKEIQINPDVQFVQVPVVLPVSSGTPTSPTTPTTGPRQLPEPLVTPLANCGPRGGLALSAWPMQGFCPAQGGLSPFIGTRTNNERWRYFTMSAIGGQPVVGTHGELYVGTSLGNMVSVGHEGHLVWQYPLAGQVTSTAAITRSGDVVFGIDTGRLVSLSSVGRPRWSTSVGSGAVTAPVVNDDGSITAGTSAGAVVSLNKAGGSRWTTSLGSPVLGVILTSTNDLYACTQSGRLVKFAASTGAIAWSLDLPGAAVTGPIAVSGGKLIVGTASGIVVGVTSAGVLDWSLNVGATISNRPAVGPTGMVLVPTNSGEIVAVSPTTHSILWRGAVGTGPVSAPIVGADGVIYAGALDGTVRALQWPDGATFWQVSLGAAPVTSLALASDGVLYAATTDGQVISIGTDPRSRIGDFANNGPRPQCVSPSGLPWDPSIAGLMDCDDSDPPWGPIAIMTGTGFGSFATVGGNRNNGQENCSVTPPSGATSGGLGGLSYTYNATDGTGTLNLSPPPSGTPASCALRFCQVQADGTESEIAIDEIRLKQNPSTLPESTSCPATAAQDFCPIDPESRTNRECTRDSDCITGDGEACGVFCDEPTCTTSVTRCGKRLTSQCADLPVEPAGAYSESDPSTWPCEELRECMETGAVAGVTGDPQFKKTGALDEVLAPPDGTTGMKLERVPFYFPSYIDTLNQTKCDADSFAKTETGQYDPRSGGSGNTTWGVYAEPSVEQHAEVSAGLLGDPTFGVKAMAGFRAGAYVWGHDIEALNTQAGIELSPCHANFTKSLMMFEVEYFSLADGGDVPSVDSASETLCNDAATTLVQKLSDMKKALYDARLAWDLYQTNTQLKELCNRTSAVFGAVESGCTVLSVRRWIEDYESKASDLLSYVDGQYRDERSQVQNALSGQVNLTPPCEKSFNGLGAAVSYPVGPIVVTMEIEVVGTINATGSVDYSALPVGPGGAGPSARVVVEPSGSVNAFVFVGAGIPGVSVGVEGKLRLFGVSVPMSTGVTLSRVAYGDPRSYSSSGLFASVSGGPGLLGGGTMHRWTTGWTHGAAVQLETMSGEVDLAARIRLLFFKKTFRKKIADWKGLERTYALVGNLGAPLDGTKSFDLNYVNTPYPEGFGLESAFSATPAPATAPGRAADLGPKTIPGVCSDIPVACSVTKEHDPCVQTADCCPGTGECTSGVCVNPPVVIL